MYTFVFLFCIGAVYLRTAHVYGCVCVEYLNKFSCMMTMTMTKPTNQVFVLLSYPLAWTLRNNNAYKGIWYWSKELQTMYGTVGDRVVPAQMATEDHLIPVRTTTVSLYLI